MRVLIVEDEPEMAALIGKRLGAARITCDTVSTMSEALEALKLFPFELMLLDRRLPDGDAAESIGAIRSLRPTIGILMLSALGASRDRVEGLDAGADDYITKPFDGDELLARIRARLRLGGSQTMLPPIFVGRLTFDPHTRRVTVADRLVPLHKREFTLLEALLNRLNCVASREELMEQIYGFDNSVAPGALDTLVSRLRRRLTDCHSGVAIHLVRGRGYLLTEAGA